jgi:hypothetical protein
LQLAPTPPPAQDSTRSPGELLYPITAELRSELRLDLRFLLRDPNRARALPLLKALNQTLERELARIRFPREALKRLADEIDGVADTLPEKSPLLDLSLKARSFARANAFEEAEKARTGPHATLPAPSGAAKSSDDALPMPRSASEEAMMLRNAAAAIEVSFVTTAELDESALAGYLNYCMTLENYDAVIGTLAPRVERSPKVWAWNLLLAAMRLSKHPDFTVTAARFHTWLEARHPEALNLASDTVDQRRFSTQKLRVLEERELGLQ